MIKLNENKKVSSKTSTRKARTSVLGKAKSSTATKLKTTTKTKTAIKKVLNKDDLLNAIENDDVINPIVADADVDTDVSLVADVEFITDIITDNATDLSSSNDVIEVLADEELSSSVEDNPIVADSINDEFNDKVDDEFNDVLDLEKSNIDNSEIDNSEVDNSPRNKIIKIKKNCSLVDLLSRSSGATMEELVCELGWKKASVRGVLSNIQKDQQFTILTINTSKPNFTNNTFEKETRYFIKDAEFNLMNDLIDKASNE